MNDCQNQKLAELYGLYNSLIKPLLIEVEVNLQKFPVPVHNEIRAFNDHVARCYLPDADIDKQLEKAESHLSRIIYDGYKCLTLYYYTESAKIDKDIRKLDLTISNGNFAIKLRKLRQTAKNALFLAKEKEGVVSKEISYAYYEKACNAYRELCVYINDNLDGIKWVKQKSYRNKLIAAFISIVTFLLGYVLNHFNEILEVFSLIKKD